MAATIDRGRFSREGEGVRARGRSWGRAGRGGVSLSFVREMGSFFSIHLDNVLGVSLHSLKLWIFRQVDNHIDGGGYWN